MNLFIIILLVVLGIGFILLELFFVPGLSLASLGGLGCLAGATYLAYTRLGLVAGHITLLLSLVATIAAICWFFHSRALDRMALDRDIDAKVDPLNGSDSDVKAGDRGTTLSRLAPAGKVLVNGQAVEGYSQNGMIDENTEVEIVSIESHRVLVRPTTPEK